MAVKQIKTEPMQTEQFTKNVSSSKDELFRKLIQSNLALQSKLADLIKSNSELLEANKDLLEAQAHTSKEISSMVALFREAGEHMVAETEEEKLRPLLGRISELVEQNKTIMRGLILIQKYIKASNRQEIPTQRPLSPDEF